MRRIMRAAACAALLCACALLPGCGGDGGDDPLADYGIGAELPRITPAPTESAPPATAAPTPSPTAQVDWAELPLDDARSQQRPTRKPSAASRAAALDEQVHERQASELDNTGNLQPNVISGGVACEFDDGQAQYVYFTATDGQLYRTALEPGKEPSFDSAQAQRVAPDNASGLMTTLQGDLAYISGGRQLVVLREGAAGGREVLCEFDELTQLTRWDDTLLALGTRDGVSGIFALVGEGMPELIVPDALGMQLDVVNRRILALDDAGLTAYSLTGDLVLTMIAGDVTAFSYSGAELYYAASGAIYRLDALGCVECVLETEASWLGCHGPQLYYLDGEGILHRSWLDGEDDEVISDGAAYNPTLLSDRIVYCSEPGGGVTASVEY